ncbi:hypothetical protein SGPA1_12073 [Streptomyces misionensis JCM 4497]
MPLSSCRITIQGRETVPSLMPRTAPIDLFTLSGITGPPSRPGPPPGLA